MDEQILQMLFRWEVRGAAVLAAALLFHFVARRRMAALRHRVGLAAVMGLWVLPALNVALPPLRVVPSVRSNLPAVAQATHPPLPAYAAPAQMLEVDIAPAPLPLSVSPQSRRVPWAAVALGLWALGAVVLLGRLGWAHLLVARACRLARVDEDPSWGDAVRRACAAQDVSRAPRLLSTECFGGPASLGVWRPTVVRPPGELPGGLGDAIAGHEVAHIARRDALSQFWASLTCALHWPNPLVWWLAREQRVSAEQACDDAVVGWGMPPSRYAERLLSLASGRAPAAIQQGLGKSFLERRIRYLVRSTGIGPASPRWAAAAGLAALPLIALAATAAPSAQEQPPSLSASPPSSVEAPVAVVERQDNALAAAGDSTQPGKVELEGRVMTESGQPIGEAHVELHPAATARGVQFIVAHGNRLERASDPASQVEDPNATSNSSGGFRIQAPLGSYDVEVWRDGYGDPAQPVKVKLSEARQHLEIRLPREATVAGVVLDPEGRPVAGAIVFAVEEGHPPSASATTDGKGRFRIHGQSPGYLRLGARHDGFLPGTTSATAPDGVVSIALARGVSISGDLVDQQGLPIADASVMLGVPGSSELRGARTDPRGRFVFPMVAPGQYEVRYASTTDRRFPDALGGGDPAVTVEVALGRKETVHLRHQMGPGIRGRIADRTGRPVSDLLVLASPHLDMKGPPREWLARMRGHPRAQTDGDGRFAFTDLEPGEYTLSLASNAAWSEVGTWLAPAGTAPLELVVESAPQVTQCVTRPDGSPARDYLFFVEQADGKGGGTTEGPGRQSESCFSIPLKMACTLTISAKVDGLWAHGKPQQIDASHDVKLPDLIASAAKRLRVTVREASSSKPIAGAAVRLADDPDTMDSSQLTDDKGMAELVVPATAAVRLAVFHSDYVARDLRSDQIASGEIKLETGGGIGGRVAGGAPDEHWRVFVVEPLGVRFARIGASGRYAMSGLAPGHHRVGFSRDGAIQEHFALRRIPGESFGYMGAQVHDVDIAGTETAQVDFELSDGRQ